MALSDCIKCWQTPCCCGYEFRNYSKTTMVAFINSTLYYKEKEEQIAILKMALDIAKSIGFKD